MQKQVVYLSQKSTRMNYNIKIDTKVGGDIPPP